MELKHNIPTEVIQLFSASDAFDYHIIPFEDHQTELWCYGSENRNYAQTTIELEVLMGRSIRIVPIPEEGLQQLLLQYYRSDSSCRQPNSRVTEITSGQGFLTSLIGEAFRDYASDIHFEPYEDRCRIRFRIDGKLSERYIIDRRQYPSLVNQIKILAGLDISEKRLPQDGRILYNQDKNKFDVRVSSLPTIYGEKIVLRLLTRHIELLELSNLGFTEKQYKDYNHAIKRPFGMVLICGPTGSGKSTTLYATLRKLNNLTENILTIEDPIEYTLEGVNQVQLKEEIGLTFTSALRTFLRQDPDIIMLGEIRDAETAQMAIRSSLTGHLLFSTIHTNTAWGAIARLTDMEIHPYLIANTLVMTVAQRLVRLLCPHCKREINANEDIHRILPQIPLNSYYDAVGCDKCFYTGYSGRKAVYEVIPIDEELATAIRSQKSDISPILKAKGIVSLKENVINLFLQGETSLEELIPLLNY